MSDSLHPHGGACQAPLSIGFSEQEYWSGLSFPSPGDLPDPEIELVSLMSLLLHLILSTSLRGRFYTSFYTFYTCFTKKEVEPEGVCLQHKGIQVFVWMLLNIPCLLKNTYSAVVIWIVLQISISMYIKSLKYFNLFTVSIILPFPECYILGIIQYGALSVWLLSLRNTHLSFLYIFLWLDSSCIFIVE